MLDFTWKLMGFEWFWGPPPPSSSRSLTRRMRLQEYSDSQASPTKKTTQHPSQCKKQIHLTETQEYLVTSLKFQVTRCPMCFRKKQAAVGFLGVQGPFSNLHSRFKQLLHTFSVKQILPRLFSHGGIGNLFRFCFSHQELSDEANLQLIG